MAQDSLPWGMGVLGEEDSEFACFEDYVDTAIESPGSGIRSLIVVGKRD